MSNSPNMGLPVPVASVTDGPEWAQDIQSSLNIIDSHTHVPGSGVPITPDGLNINSDLTVNANDILDIYSLVLTTNISTPSNLALYSDGTNLYYKDGGGTAIQITSAGSVNAGAGSITGLPSGTASATYTALTGTFTWQQATSTAANMDSATLIVRYPGSYPTPSGNYIAIQAPTALATGYSLTLPTNVPAANGAFVTSDTSGVLSYTNVDNSTVEISSSTLRVKALGIGTSQLANLAVTTGKIADSAVTTAKILDSNVTSGKIQTDVNLPGDAVRIGGLSALTMADNYSSAFKLVRGAVTSGGTLSVGEGFTVGIHPGTGIYTIVFTNQFTTTPVILISALDNAGAAAISTSATINGFTVNTFTTSSGALANVAFSFLAIGPK